MKKVIISFLTLMALSSCAGTGVKRVVIDESKREPSWVGDERLSWEDDGRMFFKSHQTVRGDQRLNGCYAIASHDNREMLIRQQVESMKGETNEAQADISENAELILGKVRSGEWAGKLYGFKDEGYFFQRVQIRDEMSHQVTERIDCYTLSSIGKADYEKSRSEILNKIVHIDQKIKDAINQKEADFFQKPAPKAEPEAKQEAAPADEAVESQPIEAPAPQAALPTKLPEAVKAPVAEAVKAPATETVKKAASEATKKVAEAVKTPSSVTSQNLSTLASVVQ